MSHTTTLKNVSITDISALYSAVHELCKSGISCSLVRNERPNMYYDNQGPVCEYVLKLDNARSRSGGKKTYDVGFQKQDDGNYVPVFDEFGGAVAGQIGADAEFCPMPTTREGRAQHRIGKLMQAYAKHAAINAACEQGYMVEDCITDNAGNVQLVMVGM